MPDWSASDRQRRWRGARVAVTIVAILIVEVVVCGLAALPGVAIWMVTVERVSGAGALRILIAAAILAPAYVVFALGLMLWSPLAARLTGAQTLPDGEWRLVDLSWPLLRWVRYMVSSHIVRVFSGTLFRGSPLWSVYLRLNGARMGKSVYINSLAIADHNLLEFGDGVVVGDDVHLSGHTVEAGVVKTARVVLGRGVTVGVGTVVDIGVTVGARSQIGALSFVPKYTMLEADAVYAGIPVKRIDREGVAPGSPG